MSIAGRHGPQHRKQLLHRYMLSVAMPSTALGEENRKKDGKRQRGLKEPHQAKKGSQESADTENLSILQALIWFFLCGFFDANLNVSSD